MDNTKIEKLSQELIALETLSKDYLPLDEKLKPLKQDLDFALEEIRQKVNNSDDVADKVFYLNRYADLIKKVESIFDNQSKRIQNSLQTIIKAESMLSTSQNPTVTHNTDSDDENENGQNETITLSPIQCNKILSILNENNKENEVKING